MSYVKRGKNDAAVAEALCEAMSRPTLRFFPATSVDEQAALMLVMRKRLIGARTQLGNAFLGPCRGVCAGSVLPPLATEFERFQEQIRDLDVELRPGIGATRLAVGSPASRVLARSARLCS